MFKDTRQVFPAQNPFWGSFRRWTSSSSALFKPQGIHLVSAARVGEQGVDCRAESFGKLSLSPQPSPGVPSGGKLLLTTRPRALRPRRALDVASGLVHCPLASALLLKRAATLPVRSAFALTAPDKGPGFQLGPHCGRGDPGPPLRHRNDTATTPRLRP